MTDSRGESDGSEVRNERESVAMRHFHEQQAREARKDHGRRQGTDMFPAAGREADRRNAELVKSAVQRSERQMNAFMEAFIYAAPCDWCPGTPDGSGLDQQTARFVIVPDEYTPSGKLKKRGTYAYACIDCAKRLRLANVDTKQLVADRKKAGDQKRADQRKQDKAAQAALFADERVNTDPIRNG